MTVAELIAQLQLLDMADDAQVYATGWQDPEEFLIGKVTRDFDGAVVLTESDDDDDA